MTCKDKIGDGKGGHDLKTVTLRRTDDALELAFMTTKPMPTTGDVLYSAMIWNNDGEIGFQLGVNYLDGEQVGYFVFDFQALPGSPWVTL